MTMMTDRDKYISDLLDRRLLHPKPGHLWCEKFIKGGVDVPGLGEISGTLDASSGLVLVSGKNAQDEAILAKLLIVRAVGPEVPAWKFRYFGGERDWGTTWAEQGIAEGVVVAVRAVAGIEQTKDDRFIEVRYDEISAIGQTSDDGPAMLPAPGWVMVDVGLDELPGKIGSLFVSPEMQDVLEGGTMQWGTVAGLPRGYSDDLDLGMDVGFDRYKYVEFVTSGNYRFMPLDEVLAVRS